MKKFEGQIIITDLDGTFLGKGASIVERNVKAVEYFKENGGFFTFATGRAFMNMRVAIPNAEDYVNAPVITANGTSFYDAANDVQSDFITLDADEAAEAVNYVLANYPGMNIRMTGKEGFYVRDLNLREKKLFSRVDPRYLHVMPMEKWPKDTWLKCVFVGDEDEITRLRYDLPERFPQFEYAFSGIHIFEFQKKGVTKGTAVRRFKAMFEEKYGRPFTVYCVGDYGNDLDMLRSADVAVCPDNAIDEVKAASDYVLCNHNDGVIGDLVELIESKL